jgi:hypothetical protein
MRISNSFSEDEIQVLDFLTQTLNRGGTPNMVVRHKAWPSVCRKVLAMKHKVKEQKAHPVPEESSVGTVEAPSAADVSAANTADIARAV